MDVLHRLRILIWVVLLGLWGTMVYQYLGEEETQDARMHQVGNPYHNLPPQPAPADNEERAQFGSPEQIPPESRLTGLPQPENPSAPEAGQEPAATTPAPEVGQATPPQQDQSDEGTLIMVQPPSSQTPLVDAPPGMPGSSLGEVRAPDYIKGPAGRETRPAPPLQPEIVRTYPAKPMPAPQEVPLPVGFIKRATRHFTIYAEGDPPSAEFMELAENLHGNLMLDLAPFSPWAKDQRVLIFLFKTPETYRQMTGRPAWSGGASSVPRRRLYLYESSELPGILAHELTHIYYDNFYAGGQTDPLWLSEGMATLVQTERGQARPTWLRENLEILERGGGFPFDELMGVTTTVHMSDANVRLWYAQSYSIVRFLIRTQYKSSFYKFSSYLREGRSVTESLYRAYGMPYNRIKALEYAWRYEITTNRLSNLMQTSSRP